MQPACLNNTIDHVNGIEEYNDLGGCRVKEFGLKGELQRTLRKIMAEAPVAERILNLRGVESGGEIIVRKHG
ncbi:MAG: hypothetical protein J7J21_04495 [Methanomicrobia archaeon]|nr:hypothetical protein [Methanomicrobia archaeon]